LTGADAGSSQPPVDATDFSVRDGVDISVDYARVQLGDIVFIDGERDRYEVIYVRDDGRYCIKNIDSGSRMARAAQRLALHVGQGGGQ